MTHQQERWIGILAIGLTGFLHLVEAPEYLDEQRYVGVLFVLSAIGAAGAIWGIAREQAWGWILGTLVAAGCFGGYLLSRTIGLPSFRENSWSAFLEPPGLISLAVEAVFLIVAVRVLARNAVATDPQLARH